MRGHEMAMTQRSGAAKAVGTLLAVATVALAGAAWAQPPGEAEEPAGAPTPEPEPTQEPEPTDAPRVEPAPDETEGGATTPSAEAPAPADAAAARQPGEAERGPLPTAPDEPSPTCAARAHAAAADAVVRIRSGDQWGAGFVYDAPNRVVTSFDLLARGRPITVVARDGTRIDAQLLARDERYDLAVLELREPVPGATPLSPAPESSARLGAPVVAIGHPFAGAAALLGERGEGLLRWSVTQGTIGAINDAGVQADVALTDGHAGGPLLDCEGRVLGLVTGAGQLSDDLGLVARIGHADEAIAHSGAPGDFLGDLRLRFGLGGGLLIDEEGRAAAGLYLSLGATLFDRISWMNRVGLFMGGLDDPTGDVLAQDRRTIRVSSLLGWRFFVDVGGFTNLYIVPAGGVSVMRQTIETERVAVVPTPDCTPSPTETCAMADIVRTSDEEWIVRPAVGLTFYFGDNFGIGYTLEIGLETAEVETHHLVRLELFM